MQARACWQLGEGWGAGWESGGSWLRARERKNRRRFLSQILRVCWREMGRDRRCSLHESDRAREGRREQTLHLHGTASDPAESAGPPFRVSRAAFPSQPGRLSKSAVAFPSHPAAFPSQPRRLSESAAPPIRVIRLPFRASRATYPSQPGRLSESAGCLSESAGCLFKSAGPPISRTTYLSQSDRLSESAAPLIRVSLIAYPS